MNYKKFRAILLGTCIFCIGAVSYTHLDVYKRQYLYAGFSVLPSFLNGDLCHTLHKCVASLLTS